MQTYSRLLDQNSMKLSSKLVPAGVNKNLLISKMPVDI